MRLQEIMTTPVLTFTRGEPASDALARMRDASVRHGVVLAAQDVVGVISDRDLGGRRGGLARKGRTVEDMMAADPLVASPEMSATEAAFVLREHRIGCLPVIEAGKLVGIVTRSDLLEALAERRRRGRTQVPIEATAPRPPLLVSPNRDKST
jgi:acetoin utilization protein AcuB